MIEEQAKARNQFHTNLWIKQVYTTNIKIFTLQMFHKIPQHWHMWKEFYLAWIYNLRLGYIIIFLQLWNRHVEDTSSKYPLYITSKG